jgi:sugar lactone lactonase YvrE
VPGATPTPTPGSGTGKLYISNQAASSILRFDNALTASGNVAPATTITGAGTTLAGPQYLFLDQAADRLFVANTGAGSILIFDTVSTKTGNATPTRTISGAATLLSIPSDLALDKGRDMLYVADGLNILVFNSASTSTANGNVAPARNIAVGFTISAIFLDATNDRLYVADAVGSAIHVYDSASTLFAVVTANRIISGVGTQLASPSGLQIDSLGRLIVSNSATPSITMYSSAATANGSPAPVATISGSNTGLSTPNQLALDPTSAGTLYIADPGSGAILIYANLSTANNNLSPTRSIKGGATTLNQNTGVALDTSR